MAPAREITGFPAFVGGRWLELLSDIAGLKRAAIMFNPDTAPASAYMPSLETAARPLKVVPIIAPVHSDAEIEAAIDAHMICARCAPTKAQRQSNALMR